MRRPARLIAGFARHAISTTTVSAWRSPDAGAPTRSFNWKAPGAGCPWVRLTLQLTDPNLHSQLEQFDQILLADQFRVRGLSVRNREPGMGTPLICVRPLNPEFGLHPSTPATVLLRGPASLAELAFGQYRLCVGALFAFRRQHG